MSVSANASGWGWIVTGILLVILSGTLHQPLIEQRTQKELQMVPPEETTPLVTLTTVAFGGFRGLVADALWLRADALQEQGQFFEMVQLAEWITQLEPRAPNVWSFQAWNLAYNISALYPNHEDRWRWISHGIELLKQEGLVHNPTSANLYWDIGWMYQHKIGMAFDVGHLFYQDQLAKQVEDILPEGLLPRDPLPEEQRLGLSETLGMKPERMQLLEEAYGPLDWRLPEAHSLYWSTEGLTFRGTDVDQNSLQRMQLQSLAGMIRGGKRVEDEESGASIRIPRLDLIPLAEDLYQKHIQEQPESQQAVTALANFLQDTCILYAEMNQLPKALQQYEKLAQLNPQFPSGRESFQHFIQHALSQHPSALTRTQALSRIVSMLILAEDPSLSPVRATGRRQIARQVHRQYQDSQAKKQHPESTGIPPFEVLQRMVASQNLWAPGLFPGL